MRLIVPSNGDNFPRNISLLFFNENPEDFFRGARIEIAQFRDDKGGDVIEEKIIKGPLKNQIKQTLDYLNNLSTINIQKIPGQAEIERTVAYPFEAMEEAIVNAIYHRSYETPPEPIKIYLYPDKMEIISYPGPVDGIEIIHLLPDSVVPNVPLRNRRIGEMLKELKLAESRGTGIPKIRRKMAENGSPTPTFEFDKTRTYFQVTLPVHPRYLAVHAIRESTHLWATGEKVNAIEHLKRAVKVFPSDGYLVAQLLEYLIENQQHDLAEKFMNDFHKLPIKTNSSQPYLRSAKIFIDKNRYDSAKKILEMMPISKNYKDLVEQAIIYKKARNFEQAHKLFNNVYSQYMDDPNIVYDYACTKLGLAKERNKYRNYILDKNTRRRLTREAIELLRRALQLYSESIQKGWCWFELAKALAFMSEPRSEVEKAYLNALRLSPDENKFKQSYNNWMNK